VAGGELPDVERDLVTGVLISALAEWARIGGDEALSGGPLHGLLLDVTSIPAAARPW
jgi:hypothetical protein